MKTMPRCHYCGRFCRPKAWKLVYSGYPPKPGREIYKCPRCVEETGPFQPQSGIRPECSCGVFE